MSAVSDMYDDAQVFWDNDRDSGCEEYFDLVCIAEMFDEVSVEEFLAFVISKHGLKPDRAFTTDNSEGVVRVWYVKSSNTNVTTI